jgi:predicted N-acetyltransferase YhbS
MEIRALRESDDRSRFLSGNEDLDRFFRRFAAQNQFRHHLGVTYVAVEDRQIVGFVTVAPGHIEIEGLPAAERRRLPHYPLPVLRLARLAVDVSVRGQGLGSQLLRFALQLASRMANNYGCIGVVVDAKADAVAYYSKHGFIEIEVIEGESDVRPKATAMFLSMRAIAAAAR